MVALNEPKTIHYDWLQEKLDKYDSPEEDSLSRAGASLALGNYGVELAREVLRLREGIEVMRDRCANLYENARATNVIGLANLANEMNVNAKALTGLLNKEKP